MSSNNGRDCRENAPKKCMMSPFFQHELLLHCSFSISNVKSRSSHLQVLEKRHYWNNCLIFVKWYISDRHISNISLRSCGELTFQNSFKGSNEIPPWWVIVEVADKLYENISVPRHYHRWNCSPAKLSNKGACEGVVSIPNFHIIITATTWSLQVKWIEGKSNSIWTWRSLETPKAICGWWVVGGIIRTCK